jgi:4-diphosphocytidyl-2-C-methyl-D-erythritol kinase
MIASKAYAKINIGLKILNKRDDGYHDIETTLTTVNLSDSITFEQTSRGISVESQGLDIPLEDNLCYRAADVFMHKHRIGKGIHIRIVKNIPIGGGLGGGSSDAACVLKGLRRLYNTKTSDEALAALGGEIGADVPFFIKGGAAYARGRGDVLTYFKLPRMSLVIYYPGYPISTKWAYKTYDDMMLTREPARDKITEQESNSKKKRVSFDLNNDFEKVVFEKHPDLLDVKANLLGSGLFCVSLSGSGSCLFTLVDDCTKDKAVRYLEGIGAQFFEVETVR